MEQEFSRPLQIRCRGLYNRGTRRGIPPDYATILDDFKFTDVARTREPIELEIDCSWIVGTSIVRYYPYKRDRENIRYIILDNTGRFYDSGLPNPGTPILGPLPAAIDFSAITLFNRVYFAPHDRHTGIGGEFMYVYDPTLGSTARSAAGFPPLSPGDFCPSAWYAADMISGILDQGKISNWYDLTGNGHHLKQTDDTKKPLWIANAINSKPALRFDGLDDNLFSNDNISSFLSADGQGTIFVIFKHDSTSGELGFLFGQEDNFRGIWYKNSTTQVNARAYSGSTQDATKVATNDAWHIVQWMYNGTNVSVALDDQDTAALVNTVSGTQTNLEQLVDVGTVTTFAYKGDIAEIIVFSSALTEENRRRVTKYIKDKYKFTDSTTDPIASLSVAASATAGNCEPGTHIVAMSYITNTGFVTKPGAHASLTLSTRIAIDVSNIPIGPPWIIKRWFWMSKIIRNWDNNLFAPELFYVKELADNTTTSLTGESGISAYDSQLVMSADPYINLLSRIPAGVGFCDYDGSLVSVGEYDIPSVARVSNKGEPEAFSYLDGFIQSGPDGGGLKNAESLYGNLYLFKSYRTYGFQRNDLGPANWPGTVIDIGRGAECFSIATVLDSISATLQLGLVVANPAGLFLFNGTYSDPLNDLISQNWFDDVTQTDDFTQTMVCVDPITKQGFVHIGGRNTYMFDYKEGISPVTIRISRWSLSGVSEYVTISCVLRDQSLMPSLIFSRTGGLKELRKITFNGMFQARERLSSLIPIPWKYHSAPVMASERSITCHLNGMIIYGTLGDGITGPGQATISLYDDIVGTHELEMQHIPQFGGPENSIAHYEHSDFIFQTLSIHLEQDTVNPSSIQIEKINLFITPDADMAPA